MVGLPLLDIILASGRSVGQSAKVAGQLVHAALADLREIESLDDSLAPETPLEFDRSTASLLRGMYERWADESERLLERIDRFERASGTRVTGAGQLRHARGRSRARLSVSLDDMEQGVRDAAEDRTVPIEEVRRDLRLRVHQAGNGPVPASRPVARGGNA
ncbi:MAG TPA: hypothetical protein VIM11_03150 [Tepidisphaeraceae bacterium]|jgi:hypothetical protein